MLPVVLSALPAPAGLRFAPVPIGELKRAYAIEEAGYPADEAASEEKLALRIAQAPEYFWGAYGADGLCGFVCGTLTNDAVLTEDSMSTHVVGGDTLCIHSVVVAEAHRRRGVASYMLREYLQRAAEVGVASRALLICKAPLVGLYASAGFEDLGPSDIVHGADPWILMRRALS